MKRGLKCWLCHSNTGVGPKREGTFPDEEGTEMERTARYRVARSRVKEPSPMKRGLKWRAIGTPTPRPSREGTFPDEEGTEIGDAIRRWGNGTIGEGTFPDEEGTEIDA